MPQRQKAFCLLLCLLLSLLLTGCYTEKDPWPNIDMPASVAPDSFETQAPAATAAPLPTQIPTEEPLPTQQPAGGLNG